MDANVVCICANFSFEGIESGFCMVMIFNALCVVFVNECDCL